MAVRAGDDLLALTAITVHPAHHHQHHHNPASGSIASVDV